VWAIVNTVVNLQTQQYEGDFLTNYATVSISQQTLHSFKRLVRQIVCQGKQKISLESEKVATIKISEPSVL
jgi:hypothetical protein